MTRPNFARVNEIREPRTGAWTGPLRIIACCLLLYLIAAAQVEAEQKAQWPRVVQSGHSLTDSIIDPLRSFVRFSGRRAAKMDASTIPGSPMDWRWSHPANPDIRQPEVIGDYDVLVITERAPLSGTVEWHNSSDWGLRWFEHAWQHGGNGRGARTILYATWIDVISGPDFDNPYNDIEGHLTFRERLPLEQRRWQKILDHVNTNKPDAAVDMVMIPGPLIMAAAYDDITAGIAPGITHISQLFEDSIHLNEMGSYLIALAHFSVIYKQDPRGLPQGVPARGGPDKAQAKWMQDLVLDVLMRFPSDGFPG
ncbi:hypothetical protein K3727_03595 [Rhodobacteraceae bacterium M382]|nr:hypothetical protein K3727_03595 [Rhodobacteraceae bacterium M382]